MPVYPSAACHESPLLGYDSSEVEIVLRLCAGGAVMLERKVASGEGPVIAHEAGSSVSGEVGLEVRADVAYATECAVKNDAGVE